MRVHEHVFLLHKLTMVNLEQDRTNWDSPLQRHVKPFEIGPFTITMDSSGDDDDDTVYFRMNSMEREPLVSNSERLSHKKHRHHYSISASSTGWKKLLWLKQPYEDNYTDSSFLSQLKRNSTVVKYSYTKLMSDCSIIVMHLSLIMSVIVVFYGIYKLDWNPLKPALLSTVLTVIGFIFYVVTLKIRRNRELIELQQFKIRQLYDISSIFGSNNIPADLASIDLEDYLTEVSPPNFFETSKSSLLIILYLLTLSPVLKSLTNSTSSDSIWALSAWLSLLNVMFNDYQIDFPKISKQEKKMHWQNILIHNFTMSQSPSISPASTRSPSVSSLNSFCSVDTEIQDNITLNNSANNNNNSIPVTATKNRSGKKPMANKKITISEFHAQPIQASNFSKNIAVSNAIVLASRLSSNASAFYFILFCIQVCGLFPTFNNFTRRCELYGFHQFQLISIVLTVDAFVWYLFGYGWLVVWLALHFMIIIVAPWYFVFLQKYKNELQGPWDPAKPIVKSI